jgi:hypothetical protein
VILIKKKPQNPVDSCVEVHVKEAQQLINAFLDDIITNTLMLSSS